MPQPPSRSLSLRGFREKDNGSLLHPRAACSLPGEQKSQVCLLGAAAAVVSELARMELVGETGINRITAQTHTAVTRDTKERYRSCGGLPGGLPGPGVRGSLKK